jgi:hypothetical protein
MVRPIEGYIFAHEVDEGFPGGYYRRPSLPALACRSVIFVRANSLDEALQYLLDHPDDISEPMTGAYIGLHSLVEDASSVADLRGAIVTSYVDGDSAARVIYSHVSRSPRTSSSKCQRVFKISIFTRGYCL